MKLEKKMIDRTPRWAYAKKHIYCKLVPRSHWTSRLFFRWKHVVFLPTLRRSDTMFQIGINNPFGIPNEGNTCYINSVLQCLFSKKKLLSFAVEHNQVENCAHGKFLFFIKWWLFFLLVKSYYFLYTNTIFIYLFRCGEGILCFVWDRHGRNLWSFGRSIWNRLQE